MSLPRRALVIGATGHIGAAIARELLARGAKVTATTRRSELPASLAGLPVSVARGDADEPGQIAAWAKGHDAIVDAAAPYPIRMFRPVTAAEARPLEHASERAAAVVEAAAAAGAQLAMIGSFTTLPHPARGAAAMEIELLRRSHPYFVVKETVERRVLAAAASGLRALVVNPTACLGPWDGKPVEQCVLPALLNGKVPATASRVVNVIDVRDVARGVVRALEEERFGERVPLSGHDVAIDELAREACALRGIRPPALRGSTRLAAVTAYWAEAAWSLAGREPPIPALPMLLVRYSYPMAPGPEQRALGVEPRPLRETLADSIAWYERIGYLSAPAGR